MTQSMPVLAAVVAATLVGYRPLWARARYIVTLIHEGGHGIAALATGRQLSGIRLHRDTSGVTLSSGRQRGPALAVTAAAGYTTPALAASAVAVLTRAGQPVIALVGALVVTGLVLLYVRNIFGLLLVGLCTAAGALLLWRAPPQAQLWACYLISAFLALGALRDAWSLWTAKSSRSGRSDADVLARCTHLPAFLWQTFFVVIAAGGVVLVAYLQFALDARP